jgi:hypothetical protein
MNKVVMNVDHVNCVLEIEGGVVISQDTLPQDIYGFNFVGLNAKGLVELGKNKDHVLGVKLGLLPIIATKEHFEEYVIEGLMLGEDFDYPTSKLRNFDGTLMARIPVKNRVGFNWLDWLGGMEEVRSVVRNVVEELSNEINVQIPDEEKKFLLNELKKVEVKEDE